VGAIYIVVLHEVLNLNFIANGAVDLEKSFSFTSFLKEKV
jgi:hypothetical protein